MRTKVNALKAFEELNRAAGDFLIADAAAAHTLLDCAELSIRTDRQRRIEKARTALAMMNRFAGRLSLQSKQRSAVDKARDLLEFRLRFFDGPTDSRGSPESSLVPVGRWPYAEAVPRVRSRKKLS